VEESGTKRFKLGGKKKKKRQKPAEDMVGMFCKKTKDISI
jgi:hypothetical protein